MIKRIALLIPIVASMQLVSACIPQHLDKYRRETAAKGDDGMKTSATSVAAQPTLPNSVGTGTTTQAGIGEQPRAETQTIYALDNKTFRFALKDDEVWDSALSVLVRNYNLTIVNRESGVVTTEWDTFFRDRTIFRNKVTLRMRRVSFRAVEVAIYNNVEKLQDGSQAGTVGAVWLPTQDDGREVGRIVQNMAVALGQPMPVLPQGMIARDALDDRGRVKQ